MLNGSLDWEILIYSHLLNLEISRKVPDSFGIGKESLNDTPGVMICSKP